MNRSPLQWSAVALVGPAFCLAVVLGVACNVKVHEGAFGGGACTTNADCTTGLCQRNLCVGTTCTCGATQCTEEGNISRDCASSWLCVHNAGNPFYGEPASDVCMPPCTACPEGFSCTVANQRVCDYGPAGADAGAEAGGT